MRFSRKRANREHLHRTRTTTNGNDNRPPLKHVFDKRNLGVYNATVDNVRRGGGAGGSALVGEVIYEQREQEHARHTAWRGLGWPGTADRAGAGSGTLGSRGLRRVGRLRNGARPRVRRHEWQWQAGRRRTGRVRRGGQQRLCGHGH